MNLVESINQLNDVFVWHNDDTEVSVKFIELQTRGIIRYKSLKYHINLSNHRANTKLVQRWWALSATIYEGNDHT